MLYSSLCPKWAGFFGSGEHIQRCRSIVFLFEISLFGLHHDVTEKKRFASCGKSPFILVLDSSFTVVDLFLKVLLSSFSLFSLFLLSSGIQSFGHPGEHIKKVPICNPY
jgi:hypothetical protein